MLLLFFSGIEHFQVILLYIGAFQNKVLMKEAILIALILTSLAGCTDEKTTILSFPNTRQSFDYSCGPGSVQAVMAYYGEDVRESVLIDLLKTDKDNGTLVKDITSFFNGKGFSTDVKEHMTTDDLKRYIDRKIPVIVLIQAWGHQSDFMKHYKETWDDGHFVVVIGYSDKNILFSDPAIFRTGYIPIPEFNDRWHDYDEGEKKTFHLGIAVYGKKPQFNHNDLERIE
jgi:uncharacterized protein